LSRYQTNSTAETSKQLHQTETTYNDVLETTGLEIKHQQRTATNATSASNLTISLTTYTASQNMLDNFVKTESIVILFGARNLDEI